MERRRRCARDGDGDGAMCFAALVAREYGGFTLPAGYDD